MKPRPTLFTAGVVLCLLIGLSGLGVGLTFLGAALGGAASGTRPAIAAELAQAALGLGLGIGGYGLLVTIGAVGVWRRSRPGWWLAIATVGFGVATLIVLAWIAAMDAVLLGGVVIWGVALGLLVAPSTRAALR